MVAPKPVNGSCEGAFVGWGAGSNGKSQTVSIQIVPKGKSSKISLNVPNSSPKSTKASPVDYVARIAGDLKIGDTVKIGYSSLGGRTWMTSVTRSGGPSKSRSGSSRKDLTAPEAFVFVGSRKVQTTAGVRMTVLARKNSNMWTFSTPTEAVDAKSKSHSRSTETSDPESRNPLSLAEQIAAYSPGDIVAMEYKTVNYRFVLESIAPFQMSATGSLTRVGKRSVRGVIHDAAFVRTSTKQSLALLVPATASTGSKTDAAALAATLKTLKTGQPVDISYRKQGGVLWLDKITAAAAAVTAKRTR